MSDATDHDANHVPEMDESRSALDLAENLERPLLQAADASARVCSGDGVACRRPVECSNVNGESVVPCD